MVGISTGVQSSNAMVRVSTNHFRKSKINKPLRVVCMDTKSFCMMFNEVVRGDTNQGKEFVTLTHGTTLLF